MRFLQQQRQYGFDDGTYVDQDDKAAHRQEIGG
jgi:hypothetical protein